MLGVGFLELLIVGPLALGSLAIPMATLVVALLVYGKVNLIEQSLNQRE